ncbi:hypothetical protein [Saccharibacillus alkalitolerans]|uniref:DUF4179 domain-containing protein n=1 Tax=Saccharibacillus alkalitolerans TaxID=2705290 RepID=A0ABX0FBB7_9BACL|nr:hypothetical protein [Saccharibacillus alkalitolerans]NGZ77359.1 hypothetical protein [Saccharibacillus alkalitolerans]
MEKYRTEERMLAEAAEEDRRERHMPSAAQRSAAIRRGMERANGGTRRRAGFVYGGAGAAALAAGALLIGYGGFAGEGTAPSEPSSSQAADPQKVEPSLEPFYPLVMRNDSTIASALKRGAATPTDIVSERDGFALNIRGTVRDSRSVTLFYTLKGPGGDRLSLNRPKLVDASTGKTATWEEDGAPPNEQFDVFERAQYGVITMPLRPEFGGSEQFALKAYAVSGRVGADGNRLQTFDVPLTVASNADEEQYTVFEQPKTLKVGGQSVEIERMLVTPLRIYLSVSQETEQTFFSLVNPRLVVTHDGKRKTLARESMWPYPDRAEKINYRLVYANTSGTGRPDSIAFRAEGIAKAPEAGSVFVVDTEKSEVLRAPGEDYAASLTAAASTDLSQLTVTYPISSKDWAENRSLLLDLTFTDGDGKTHKLREDANGSFGGGMSNADGTASAYVYLEKLDYPQPLTFKVAGAPGWTKDEQEITLK